MPSRSLCRLTVLLLVSVSWVLAGPARGAACSTGQRPGATLLIPYFEVDVARADGPDTLFSVNNADPAPVLARVVLWTDLGLPTLAFDVYLDAHAVASFSLRRILVDGLLPRSGDASTPLEFPSCAVPLAAPVLDAAALAELQARHRGRPAPSDGLCHGAPRGDALAVGYVTVDVIRDCSAEIVLPTDPGYYDQFVLHGPEMPGLIGGRNVLWGDVTLLDPSRSSAQGFAAVALAHREARKYGTFWEDFSGGRDDRASLAETTRSRFLNGGAFDGGTDLVIWNQGIGPPFPQACGDVVAGVELRYRFANEAGETLDERVEREPRRTARRRLGEDLPTPSPFGFVEIAGERLAPVPILPFFEDVQVLAVPLFEAEGRFSVGLPGTEIVSECARPAESAPSAPLAWAAAIETLLELDPSNGTYRETPRLDLDTGSFYFVDFTVGGGRFFGLAATPIESINFMSIDLASGQPLLVRHHDGGGSLAWGPQGRLWLLVNGELRQVDPDSGDTIRTLPLAEGVGGLVADAADLFAWQEEDGRYTLMRIDTDTGALEPRWTIELGEGVRLQDSDFAPDGTLWVLGLEEEDSSLSRYYRVRLDRPEHRVRAELTARRRPDVLSRRPHALAFEFPPTSAGRVRAGGARPAATLLVPYFEVEPERAGGRNTLVSVNNAGERPVLANVVLWTDWGLPSLAFPLHLEPGGGRVVDLRRLFTDGRLPALGAAAAEAHPGCAGVAEAAVADVADLVARHTGRPRPSDGLCYGAPRADGRAVGYLTVDVVRDCPAEIRTPADDGYFGAGGPAGADNVLWGEVFLVDESSDSAQGFAAVAVPAALDPAPGSPSFYSRSDDRLPLGCEARTRYFENGVFDGGTELLVWSAASPAGGEPLACGTLPMCPVQVEVSSRLESGVASERVAELRIRRRTARLTVGAEDLPVAGRFGSLDVQTLRPVGCELFTANENVQTWVVALMSARGRFSVALEAADLGGTCN